LAAEPDRFSFPSGHAAAAMSVAMGYAMVFPNLAVPLVLLAAAVGASRVYLGVHYPGDVLVGQLLALMVGVAMVSM
jgi:undecaprenyl-diphosphatase